MLTKLYPVFLNPEVRTTFWSKLMPTGANKSLMGEMLAEFLGTLILIALGDGVVAMVVLFGKGVEGEVIKGGYTNITLGWGLAVLMGICVAGRISGAHLNPAVTLTLALFRKFSWPKVLPYCLAQVAGAFAGAALVYINYRPKFLAYDGPANLVGVFATFPFFPDQWVYGFLDQIIGTAILLCLILAITDPGNHPVTSGLEPVLIALVVVAIGISWGGMHGYAINPARDFGPRLFALMAGFKDTGFENYLFVVPIIGPLLGGILGALTYDGLIRPYLPKEIH
jgi:glycerol uptake facilitator protein